MRDFVDTRTGAIVAVDCFSIELIGSAYNGYARGGYIEGGNVQADP